tara:strand:+ start:2603 stop:3439 length:837 start_codon:yes stop_codon:yes gene_type:complete
MTLIGNKYEIHNIIGEGTFGRVFKGINIRTKENIAIKIQYKDISKVLRHEAKIYQHLKDVSGVPQIRNFGSESGFNYLIIDLLDTSLLGCTLIKEQTIKYMISAVNIIEHIHNKGIIHRDIKPDNFLIKTSSQTLYIIDFGLSKCFLDSNQKHIVERKDRKLVGTAKFSSLNVHNGIESSRRDDIEAICYSFINLFGKKLPWEEIIEYYKKDNSENKLEITYELYDKIKDKKNEPLNWLHDIPGEFLTILLYCRQLKFDEKPNYNYIRKMLNNLLQIL